MWRHPFGTMSALNSWCPLVTCLYSRPFRYVNNVTSCLGALPENSLFKMRLQNGSDFCRLFRVVKSVGVGSSLVVTDSTLSVSLGGCLLTVSFASGVVCSVSAVGVGFTEFRRIPFRILVLLRVLSAGPSGVGPSGFGPYDVMLMWILVFLQADSGNSTSRDRQSADLFVTPAIHSKVMS